jgi:glucose-1-phosphate thymidylyltransferase
MHAVVLAGGYATRLWPITRHRPKMLLPVGDTTVITRILDGLAGDERIDTVHVSTNEAFADQFRTHITEEGYEKARLSVESTTEEESKFGVVGALAQLVEREGIDDDLFVIGGDNLIGFDVADFLDFFEARDGAALAAYDVGSRERARSYGIVELDGDRVVDFAEKPDEPRSTLASIACYAFPAEFVRFAEYLSGDNNPDEPGWYVDWLSTREPVFAFSFDDVWFDIGTPESYLEAVEWALDGGSRVHPEATVENCEIGETVHVMAGATLTGSTVERSVVFPGADVRECRLDETLLGADVTIEGLDVTDAVMTTLSTED